MNDQKKSKIKPAFTDLEIQTSSSGFYEGYSLPIALVSKTIMVLLVIWALLSPKVAGEMLDKVNWQLLQGFNAFYIVSAGFFIFFLLIIAAVPAWGKKRLGPEGVPPEFSNFSWFSMMFGAGLGVGLMVFATAEPIGLWGSNPVIIENGIQPYTKEAVQSAYRYTFAHYGFHAWAIYVVTGLSLAYYAYTRDMPLTIRSALTPIFGRYVNGILGHIIDIIGVVATILGVSVTIGFGVSQFVDGVYSITGMEWLMKGDTAAPEPSQVGLLSALVLIMTMSIISAVSGVGRGVKYLSNLNLILSIVLLMTFVIFGSFLFAMSTYVSAFLDYITSFLTLSFDAYTPLATDTLNASLPDVVRALPADDLAAVTASSTNPWGTFDSFKEALPASFNSLANSDALAKEVYASGTNDRLFGWQSSWTTFYWAWWIAFSPFVGLFLARISKGRTIREFILGAVIAPSLVCFAWMTILGATAIDLELTGGANGNIIGASNTAKLFVTLGQMIDGSLLSGITIMCVVLIMTFLVTSADSGILVMNTIMSGGAEETGVKHRIIWGVILTLVIGALIVAGDADPETNPMDALQDAMIIGALPFTFIMVLMCISLIKALIRDGMRDK